MRRLMACWGIAVLAAAAYPYHVSGQRPDEREITFARDVAPIVYANCAYCHRPGEVAPFSLMTYRDARPWARVIKQAVGQKSMPPWRADPHYGEFQNPRVLSDRRSPRSSPGWTAAPRKVIRRRRRRCRSSPTAGRSARPTWC